MNEDKIMQINTPILDELRVMHFPTKEIRHYLLTPEILWDRVKRYKEDGIMVDSTLMDFYGYISTSMRKKDIWLTIAFSEIKDNVFCRLDWDVMPEHFDLYGRYEYDAVDELALKYLYVLEIKTIKKACQTLQIRCNTRRYYDGDRIKDEETEATLWFSGGDFDDGICLDREYLSTYDPEKGKSYIETIEFNANKHLVDAFLKVHKTYFDRALLNVLRGHKAKMWAETVKERDKYSCVECGSGDMLEAHHIIGFKENPSLRYVLENGITLCKKCHRAKHNNCFLPKIEGTLERR